LNLELEASFSTMLKNEKVCILNFTF